MRLRYRMKVRDFVIGFAIGSFLGACAFNMKKIEEKRERGRGKNDEV